MEKIVVDPDVCIGCGACVNICDEVFDFSEEGMVAKAIDGKNEIEKMDNEIKDNALDALDSCPVGATKIEKED